MPRRTRIKKPVVKPSSEINYQPLQGQFNPRPFVAEGQQAAESQRDQANPDLEQQLERSQRFGPDLRQVDFSPREQTVVRPKLKRRDNRILPMQPMIQLVSDQAQSSYQPDRPQGQRVLACQLPLMLQAQDGIVQRDKDDNAQSEGEAVKVEPKSPPPNKPLPPNPQVNVNGNSNPVEEAQEQVKEQNDVEANLKPKSPPPNKPLPPNPQENNHQQGESQEQLEDKQGEDKVEEEQGENQEAKPQPKSPPPNKALPLTPEEFSGGQNRPRVSQDAEKPDYRYFLQPEEERDWKKLGVKKPKGVFYQLIEIEGKTPTEYFYDSVSNKFFKLLIKNKSSLAKANDLQETTEVSAVEIDDRNQVLAFAIKRDRADTKELFQDEYQPVMEFLKEAAAKDNYSVLYEQFAQLDSIEQYKVIQALVGTEKLRKAVSKQEEKTEILSTLKDKLAKGAKDKVLDPIKKQYETSAVEQLAAKYDWKKFAHAMRLVTGVSLLESMFATNEEQPETDLQESDLSKGKEQKYAPPNETKKVFNTVKLTLKLVNEAVGGVSGSLQELNEGVQVEAFGAEIPNAKISANVSGAANKMEGIAEDTNDITELIGAVPGLGLTAIKLQQEIDLLLQGGGNLDTDQLAESCLTLLQVAGKVSDTLSNSYAVVSKLAGSSLVTSIEQAVHATVLLEPIIGGLKLATGVAEFKASRAKKLEGLKDKFADQAISKAVSLAQKGHKLKRTTGAMKAASGAAQLVGGVLLAVNIANPVGWAFLTIASVIGMHTLYKKVKSKHQNINEFVDEMLLSLPEAAYRTTIHPAISQDPFPDNFDKATYLKEHRHEILQALTYSSAKDFYEDFIVEVSRSLYEHAVLNYDKDNPTCQEAYSFITDGLGLKVNHAKKTPEPAMIGRSMKGK